MCGYFLFLKNVSGIYVIRHIEVFWFGTSLYFQLADPPGALVYTHELLMLMFNVIRPKGKYVWS